MTETDRKNRRQDFRACLEDMLECASVIAEYTSGMTAQDFIHDRKTQDAVLRRFEVMGEAAGRLIRNGAESGGALPNLVLREMYGMRNALIHGYDSVDVSVVWATVVRDIPILREALTDALKPSANP